MNDITSVAHAFALTNAHIKREAQATLGRAMRLYLYDPTVDGAREAITDAIGGWKEAFEPPLKGYDEHVAFRAAQARRRLEKAEANAAAKPRTKP